MFCGLMLLACFRLFVLEFAYLLFGFGVFECFLICGFLVEFRRLSWYNTEFCVFSEFGNFPGLGGISGFPEFDCFDLFPVARVDFVYFGVSGVWNFGIFGFAG